MTTFNKATLKAFFETGDVPLGQQYSDLIDSCINIVDTSAQSIVSPISVGELITPRVSAVNGSFTGVVSALGLIAQQVAITDFLSVTGATSMAVVSASRLNVSTDVSADGSIYASAVRSINGMFDTVGIVSAAGTAQATGAPLVFATNRGKGVVDGSTTGFTLQANRTGLTQYLFNDAVSANLWPPSGGAINGLANNAAFALAASTLYTIKHITASAYAVK